MTSEDNYTTKQQLHEALETWLDAQSKATDAAAEYTRLKGIVGGNEADRKAQRAKAASQDEYDGYLLHYADAEKVKIETAAAAERAEKILNTLRELLNNETAEVWDRITERQTAATERAYETAVQYAALPGNKTTFAEIRAHTRPQPVAAGSGVCADCRQPLALDIHKDCLPF
jgi:DNA-binding ferritin-like protein